VALGRVSAARRIGASRNGGCARSGILFDGIFEVVCGMEGGWGEGGGGGGRCVES